MIRNNSILNIIKHSPVISSEDSVRRAAGLIRASEGTVVFVRNGYSVSGVITAQKLSEFLADSENEESSLSARVDSLAEDPGIILSPNATIGDALHAFGKTHLDILPVIDANGSLIGSLNRDDVLGIVTRTNRPQSVGGMATPLGVYLTTGTHNGGAGHFGLFLTGVSLRLMMAIAGLVVVGIYALVQKITGIHLDAMMASTPLTTGFSVLDIPLYISSILIVAIFLLILRISPLSGYHAAEHMTVHAIEMGEELIPGIVRYMPRVHPRCGSNILAIAGVFMIISSVLGGEIAVMAALLVIILGWRKIGGLLQSLITTAPPNDKQLASGIKAGREVMEKYQDNPVQQATGFARILNMGFLQTLFGMAAMQLIISLILHFLNTDIFI